MPADTKLLSAADVERIKQLCNVELTIRAKDTLALTATLRAAMEPRRRRAPPPLARRAIERGSDMNTLQFFCGLGLGYTVIYVAILALTFPAWVMPNVPDPNAFRSGLVVGAVVMFVSLAYVVWKNS